MGWDFGSGLCVGIMGRDYGLGLWVGIMGWDYGSILWVGIMCCDYGSGLWVGIMGYLLLCNIVGCLYFQNVENFSSAKDKKLLQVCDCLRLNKFTEWTGLPSRRFCFKPRTELSIQLILVKEVAVH